MFHSVQKHLQKIKSWQALHAITNPCTPFKYHACSFLPDLSFSLQNYNRGQGGKPPLTWFYSTKRKFLHFVARRNMAVNQKEMKIFLRTYEVHLLILLSFPFLIDGNHKCFQRFPSLCVTPHSSLQVPLHRKNQQCLLSLLFSNQMSTQGVLFPCKGDKKLTASGFFPYLICMISIFCNPEVGYSVGLFP